MKIWYQSGVSVGKDPRYDEYGEILTSHLNKISRPGTEVTIHGVETCSPHIMEYNYEALLHNHQIVENLIKAQREGYDAFCVTCLLDPAFYALREVADIPVCSIAETSMFLACLLSPNFSILTYNKMLLRRIIELVKRYGLQERFIETDILPIGQSEEAIHQALKSPDTILEPAKKVAEEAMAKGVGMFINGDGRLNTLMVKHNIHQIEGIPVLEGAGGMIKVAEMLVDLKEMGTERSKLGLYTQIPQGDLASLRKLYGME